MIHEIFSRKTSKIVVILKKRSEPMKKGILCLLVTLGVCLILAAGCTTTTSSTTGTSGNSGASGTTGNHALSQKETAVLVNGTYSVNVSIEEITVDRSQSGSPVIDIYIHAKNDGTSPIQLQWFSSIVDANGVSHGGIGISHGGSGAVSAILGPGDADTARDYVVIDSDTDYRALANGATLEVFFITEPLSQNETPVEFSTAWALNPAVFT
jgi:hypothetical protein